MAFDPAALICVFIVVAFIYLYNAFLVGVYGLSIWRLLLCWIKSFFDGDTAALFILGFIFTWLFVLGILYALLATVYDASVRKAEESLYLGHRDANYAVYIRTDKKNAEPYEVKERGAKNFSFADVHRYSVRYVNANKPEQVIQGGQFGFKRNAGLVLLMLAFLIPQLVLFHVLAVEYHQKKGNPLPKRGDQKRKWFAFFKYTAYEDGKGVVFCIFFACLALPFLVGLEPSSADESQAPRKPLPTHIKPGASVSAVPVAHVSVTDHIYNDEKGEFETRLTGQKDLTLKFSEGFDNSVYVTARYTPAQGADNQALIEEKITAQAPITVELNNKLEVILGSLVF